MKTRLVISIAVFFNALSTAGGAIDNPAISNPAGIGTVPPSSIRSGLVRSSNPIDRGSDMVVTGNVGGGKHFRGVVPYNAISDFAGTLGSTSLDSFLRRWAGSGEFSPYTGKLTPYYSQTGTVTSIQAGGSSVFRPTREIDSRTETGYFSPAPLRQEALNRSEELLDLSLRNPQTPQSAFEPTRPMSMNLHELEKEIAEKVEKTSRTDERESADAQYRKRMEQFRQDLRQIIDKAADLKQKMIIEQDILEQPPIETEPEDQLHRQFEQQTPKEPTEKEGSRIPVVSLEEQDTKLDVYEQMRQQIEQLKKTLGQLPDAKKPKDVNDTGHITLQSPKVTTETEELKGLFTKELAEAKKGMQIPSDLSARARTILGSHKSFASFSADKFNQYMSVAEEYLREGRYYRAADVYTLASVYKPADPLAYAGKSHALFAAGEYMSSALFLSRALNLFPDYAWFKVDLVAMIGDRDKVESRIANIEQLLEKNDTGELHFLLAYVYYQINRLSKAKSSIDAAAEKMPDSAAVAVLKRAIDGAVK
jgi:tetratricopeptide (TPR) repeat protein